MSATSPSVSTELTPAVWSAIPPFVGLTEPVDDLGQVVAARSTHQRALETDDGESIDHGHGDIEH